LASPFSDAQPAGSLAAAKAKYGDSEDLRKWQAAAIILEKQTREMCEAFASVDWEQVQERITAVTELRRQLTREQEEVMDTWIDRHETTVDEWIGWPDLVAEKPEIGLLLAKCREGLGNETANG
jgi:hypothetical protein